jgi:PKD repeat protein
VRAFKSEWQAFKATVTSTTNSAVSWEVNNLAGGNSTVGTISPSGVYTPPATVSATLTVAITATSVAVKTQSATAQVTVIAPPSRGGGAQA